MILVQMHGDPGSGKSALARAIGLGLPAIVVDKDAISSPLISAGIESRTAGGASYEVMRELAFDFLSAGHSVVLDSPCAWPLLEEKGRALAARFGIPWAMVESACPEHVIDLRLATRDARGSQPKARMAWYDRPGTYRPSRDRLVVDSLRPLEEIVAEAIAYLRAICLGHDSIQNPESKIGHPR